MMTECLNHVMQLELLNSVARLFIVLVWALFSVITRLWAAINKNTRRSRDEKWKPVET